MSWNEYILSDFPEAAFSPISILFDPQALVGDESVFAELERRGYMIQEYSDTLSIRYTYETSVRNNPNAKWIIIVRDEHVTKNELPYDIVRFSRQISVSIEDLFPNLNYAVVNDLDRRYLSDLFDLKEEIPYGIQSSGQTCEFILERLFSLSTDIVNDESSLLSLLSKVHFNFAIHSSELLNYMANKISAKRQFKDWDIDKLFLSSGNYSLFLQERLLAFLDENPRTEWQIKGSSKIDFTSLDVKRIISHLFSSGNLSVNPDKLEHLIKYLAGTASPASFSSTVNAFAAEIEQCIPTTDSGYQAWLDFAKKWAELTALSIATTNKPAVYDSIQKKVNDSFVSWQKEHYQYLLSLPSNPPVMLHQIIRAVERRLFDKTNGRFALIVVDGLALNQWMGIRSFLENDFAVNTGACFAWIPTLTSISRQALFSGKAPMSFSSSISTTSKEETLWQQAWESFGIKKTDVFYKKNLGSGEAQEVLDMITPRTKICGLVINMVDNIIHGIQLGNAGIHNQLSQWMSAGYLNALLSGLLEMGFDIILTSDHGNIDCTGIGRPQDSALSEQHGERIRIYSDQSLLAHAHVKCPQAFDIKPVGLPTGMFPMSLPYNQAFATVGERLVAHGGNSLEEVIVPLIQIAKK